MENANAKAVILAILCLILSGVIAIGEKIITAFSAVCKSVVAGFAAVRSIVPAKFSALAIVIVMAGSLSGCSGLTYFGDNYSGIESVKFEHDDRNWLIFDNPEKNRLMIISSWRGLGFGHTPPVYRDAAIAYFASQSKECKVTNFHKIQGITEFQWEVEYSCSDE